jgi:hypothetical protein
MASNNGHIEVVTFLVERGVDVKTIGVSLYGTHTVQKVFFTCHANASNKQCQLESRKQLWEQIEVQQQLQQDTTS